MQTLQAPPHNFYQLIYDTVNSKTSQNIAYYMKPPSTDGVWFSKRWATTFIHLWWQQKHTSLMQNWFLKETLLRNMLPTHPQGSHIMYCHENNNNEKNVKNVSYSTNTLWKRKFDKFKMEEQKFQNNIQKQHWKVTSSSLVILKIEVTVCM